MGQDCLEALHCLYMHPAGSGNLNSKRVNDDDRAKPHEHARREAQQYGVT